MWREVSKYKVCLRHLSNLMLSDDRSAQLHQVSDQNVGERLGSAAKYRPSTRVSGSQEDETYCSGRGTLQRKHGMGRYPSEECPGSPSFKMRTDHICS